MTDNFNFDDYDFGNSPLAHTVDDAIRALEEGENETGTAVAYGLSDLPSSEVARFKQTWSQLDTKSRYALVEHLTDISESNFELDYRTVGFVALKDNDRDVRAKAIDLLWTDESSQLLEELVHMARWDADNTVRARAMSGLGRFIRLGEYGKIRSQYRDAAQEAAIDIWSNTNEQVTVRRRALEAISNSSNPVVSEIILEGYNSHDDRLVVSAVYGMGRSCDERWASTVLQELASDDPAMRYEAARASGELELQAAIPALRRLALSGERDIQEASIWALGEIGGDKALQVLDKIAESLTGESWQEVIDEAINNASLGMGLPDLVDFQELEDL